MASLESWFAGVEEDFWRAHNEVMEATGVRRAWEALTHSSGTTDSFLSGIKAEAVDFLSSVNWTEPIFRYLALFHLLVLVAVFLATRGAVTDERLIAVCVVLTTAVLAGFAVNKVGGRYAEVLFVEPGVNYFTEDGIFVAVVYMAPMIVLVVGLQIRMAVRLLRLMAQVKGAQVRRRLRREAKAKERAEGGEEGSEKSKKEQ